MQMRHHFTIILIRPRMHKTHITSRRHPRIRESLAFGLVTRSEAQRHYLCSQAGYCVSVCDVHVPANICIPPTEQLKRP